MLFIHSLCSVTFHDVFWNGNFNSTKDNVTEDGIGRLNDVHVNQEWSNVSVSLNWFYDVFLKHYLKFIGIITFKLELL